LLLKFGGSTRLGLSGGEIGLLLVTYAKSSRTGVVQLAQETFFGGFVLQYLGMESPGLAAADVCTAGQMGPGAKNSDTAEHQLLHGVRIIFSNDDSLFLSRD
jgi:hypothetical protein